MADNALIVLNAFETLFNKRDYAAAERIWSPNYIQHSAHIPPGREGLFALIKGAPEALHYENGLTVANGDYVLLHGRFSGLAVEAIQVVHLRLAGETGGCKTTDHRLEPQMNVHKNARLTPQGRLLMVRRIEEEGWKVADAASAAGLSVRPTHHWLGRDRAGGERVPWARGQRDAPAFLERAVAWYHGLGIPVEGVRTDNGSAYRPKFFATALPGGGPRHIRTRPYTPRTNGKAERFIQTSLREWAYARVYSSSAERTQAMQPWILDYNHSRPHSALGGLPPAARLNNVFGFDS